MTRTLAAALCLVAATASTADSKYTVKVEDADPPKELSDAIRATLDNKAMRVTDDTGKLLCTVWACKALETKATADQAKALKYAHVEPTTLVGAVQFPEVWKDYRKQNMKAGVYTLRIAVQPE